PVMVVDVLPNSGNLVLVCRGQNESSAFQKSAAAKPRKNRLRGEVTRSRRVADVLLLWLQGRRGGALRSTGAAGHTLPTVTAAALGWRTCQRPCLSKLLAAVSLPRRW